MKRTAGNLFVPAPESIPEEIFEALVENASLKLERIVSTGHATPPGEWYDQERDEWVVLLHGSAGLLFADEAQARELRPGDYVLIPAHCRHRVEWTDEAGPTVWLALHFVDSTASGEVH